MVPYIFIFVICILFGKVWERLNKNVKILFLFAFILLLTIFIGTKYGVGTDDDSYKNKFIAISLDSSFSRVFPEFGYYFLNKIAYKAGFDIQFVYIFCGFIIAYFTVNAAYVININPFYFFVITFPFHIVMLSMSGIRQGVAESILIYSIARVVSNRGRFYHYLIASLSFHISTIFFVIFNYMNVKKRWALLYLIVLLPVIVFSANARYGHYSEVSLYSQGVYLRTGFLCGLATIFYLNLKIYKYRFDSILEKRMVYFSIIMSYFLFIFASFSTTLIDRISFYFILIVCLLYIKTIKSFSNKIFCKISLSITIVFSFLCMITFFIVGNNGDNYLYNSYIFEWLCGLG